MESFNAVVKEAARTFFGGFEPRRNRYLRTYSVSWAFGRDQNPPPGCVLRDFFAEQGFDPKDVIVTVGGCSLYFEATILN